MPRNYEKEKQWAKDKYMRFDVKLDREQFENTITLIKENIGGNAEFLKRALKLYEDNPDLFKDVN